MKQILRVVFGLLMLWAVVLRAEVRIEITQGVDSACPISVVPFQWAGLGATSEDISSIVGVGLRSSGEFNPLDRPRLPQRPNTVQEVQPVAWSALGVDAIVVGQVTLDPDGSYSVAYQLVDTGGAPGAILTQNIYKANKQWLCYVGHTASGEVFEKLTGIKGVFRTHIAYVIQANGGQFPYELHMSDYDSYNQFVVHRPPQSLMSPAWSPDGLKLMYVTLESGCSALVIQILSDGAIRQVASFPHHNGAPAFPPDGSKLAFILSKTGSLNLYVMDIGSGQIRQVTDGCSNNTEPTWFPDSQNLVFMSDQAGRPQAYKVNVNGDAPQRIIWEGLQNQDADVSSDDKSMVMVSSTNGQQYTAKQDLVTGGVQVLLSTFLNETPSLVPNGTTVTYSSSQGMGSVLNLVSIDGCPKARPPATDGQVKSSTWSPYL